MMRIFSAISWLLPLALCGCPAPSLEMRSARSAALSLFVLAVLAAPGLASAQTANVMPASSRGSSGSLHRVDASPLLPQSPRGTVSLLAASSPDEPSSAQARLAERQRKRLDTIGTHAYLVYYGLSRGFVHGLLLAETLKTNTDTDALLAFGVPIGETVVAVILASSEGMTPGRAHVIGTGLDFGLIAGFMVGGLAGASYGEYGTVGPKTYLPPLALSLAGGVASGLLVDATHLTWGDMEFIHMSGIIGAVSGAAALGSRDRPGRDWATLGALVGSAGGLALGGVLVQGKDFSVWQSLVMDGSALVAGITGTLVALGTGLGDDDSVLIGAASGSAALGLSYLLLSPFAIPAEEKAPVKLSLQFAPGSLSTRDTRRGRPTPMTLLLNGRF
jgi:hypothetical protein